MSKNQTYIIALVDVRGSAGRGEKNRQAVYGSLGAVEAADVSKIIRLVWSVHATMYYGKTSDLSDTDEFLYYFDKEFRLHLCPSMYQELMSIK